MRNKKIVVKTISRIIVKNPIRVIWKSYQTSQPPAQWFKKIKISVSQKGMWSEVILYVCHLQSFKNILIIVITLWIKTISGQDYHDLRFMIAWNTKFRYQISASRKFVRKSSSQFLVSNDFLSPNCPKTK